MRAEASRGFRLRGLKGQARADDEDEDVNVSRAAKAKMIEMPDVLFEELGGDWNLHEFGACEVDIEL